MLREKCEELDVIKFQNKKLEELLIKNEEKNHENEHLLGEYANKISSMEVQLKEHKSTQ